MTIFIDIKDIHGLQVELNERIAMRVVRRSGSDGSWCQKRNINHNTYYWIPGEFVIDLGNHGFRFRPEEASESALMQPIGKERIEQIVDYYNINIYDPNNLDKVNIPPSGSFWEENKYYDIIHKTERESL